MTRKSLWIPLFFLSILFIAAQLPAQENDLPTRSGNVAINFLFDGLTLSTPQYGIGAKYWCSEQTAIKTVAIFHYIDYIGSTKQTTVGLSLGFEEHPIVKSPISPYAGIEAGITQQYTTYSYNVTTLNGSVALGIEYFFLHYFSFAAEQMFSASYSRTKSYADTFNSGSSWRAGFGTSSLIFSIYF